MVDIEECRKLVAEYYSANRKGLFAYNKNIPVTYECAQAIKKKLSNSNTVSTVQVNDAIVKIISLSDEYYMWKGYFESTRAYENAFIRFSDAECFEHNRDFYLQILEAKYKAEKNQKKETLKEEEIIKTLVGFMSAYCPHLDEYPQLANNKLFQELAKETLEEVSKLEVSGKMSQEYIVPALVKSLEVLEKLSNKGKDNE